MIGMRMLAGALAFAGLGAEPQAPAPPDSAGAVVVIGGALDPDYAEVYRSVLDRTRDRGHLCIIPTASPDPREAGREYARRFRRHRREGDPKPRLISITLEAPERARDPLVVAALRRCAGFFFTGGDQSRIVEALRPDGRDTPALLAIRQAWRKGAVVAGTSAGSAIWGDAMVAGGSSVEAFEHGVTRDPAEPGVWVRPGLGFFHRGLTGQHFFARGRFGRLLVAVAETGRRHGLGVGENTALILDGDEAKVLGRNGVLVLELADEAGEADARGTVWVLGDGDELRWTPDGKVRPVPNPERTDPCAAPELAPQAAAHPWQDDAFARLLRSVGAGTRDDLRLAAGDGGLRIEPTPRLRCLSDPTGTTAFVGPLALKWRRGP